MLTSTNDFETYYADPKTFAEIPIKYLFFEVRYLIIKYNL